MSNTVNMYIGVDVGGSKTLVASFASVGEIIDSKKMPTPDSPNQLIQDVFEAIDSMLGQAPEAIAFALPGTMKDGHFTNSTTLKWQDVPFEEIVQRHTSKPCYFENDAMLGGLAEARIGNGQGCINLLYITISTGVGTGIIIDGNIPDFLSGSEGGLMYIGEETIQSRISGPAFKRRFGRHGYEVDDLEVWRTYAKDLAYAIYDMSSLIEPEKVVLGGGMSVHFDKFSAPLQEHLTLLQTDEFSIPEVLQARYPEFAVIHGCGILAIEGRPHA